MQLRRPLCFALLLAALPAVGLGQTAPSERDAAEARRESVKREIDAAAASRAAARRQAAALTRDVDELREQMKAAAASMRDRRAAAAAATSAAAAAGDAADEALAAIERRRREFAALLGAMARMSLRPSEALAALDEGPVEAARASLAFRALLPEIERRIADARASLNAAATLRRAHEARLVEARAAADALVEERRVLDRAVAEKRRLLRQAEARDGELARQAAALAKEAESLDAFVKSLAAREAAVAAARAAEKVRQARAAAEAAEAAESGRLAAAHRHAFAARPTADAPPPEPVAVAATPEPAAVERTAPPEPRRQPTLALTGLGAETGRATPPVAGRLAAGYGKGEGVFSRGWLYAAPTGAEVFAPYDGRVAYAGPFRGYGMVALIDHGGGYHSLLTGLGRVDVAAGDFVLQGEPLGALPEGQAGGIGPGASEQGGAKLYVELRKDGEPVDPAPWFARPT